VALLICPRRAGRVVCRHRACQLHPSGGPCPGHSSPTHPGWTCPEHQRGIVLPSNGRC